eukprot:928873_1
MLSNLSLPGKAILKVPISHHRPLHMMDSMRGSLWCPYLTYHHYFFILGRGGTLGTSNMVQILNVTSNQWLDSNSVPQMNQIRSDMACITHENHQLYVIGGKQSDNTYHDSIEVLDVAALFDNGLDHLDGDTNWIQLSDTLDVPMYSGRALLHYHYVLYIGGKDSCMTITNDIYIIDTKINTVAINGALWDHTMISTPAAIIVNTRLYVFGVEQYNFMELPQPPTYQPSVSPTTEPTSSTATPTLTPIVTKSPSQNPTNAPSFAPTYLPSNAPSTSPSDAPSLAPSSAPTRIPTMKDPYDSYFDVVYGLYSLSDSDAVTLTSDTVHVVMQ